MSGRLMGVIRAGMSPVRRGKSLSGEMRAKDALSGPPPGVPNSVVDKPQDLRADRKLLIAMPEWAIPDSNTGCLLEQNGQGPWLIVKAAGDLARGLLERSRSSRFRGLKGPIHFGGPVETGRGLSSFVELRRQRGTLDVGGGIGMNATLDSSQNRRGAGGGTEDTWAPAMEAGGRPARGRDRPERLRLERTRAPTLLAAPKTAESGWGTRGPSGRRADAVLRRRARLRLLPGCGGPAEPVVDPPDQARCRAPGRRRWGDPWHRARGRWPKRLGRRSRRSPEGERLERRITRPEPQIDLVSARRLNVEPHRRVGGVVRGRAGRVRLVCRWPPGRRSAGPEAPRSRAPEARRAAGGGAARRGRRWCFRDRLRRDRRR